MVMKFILGKKIEMSQIFKNDQVVPVTLIKAGPCFVTQIKTKEKDKYEAIQIGFEKKKSKKIKKTEKGKEFKYLKEFRIKNSKSEIQEYKIGDKIEVSIFKPGEKVTISGLSKGRGFAGVVKRHGFKGMPASHGTKHDARHPGSIGATAPQRVLKGKKMAGRMGNERVSIKNLEVIEVQPEKNLLIVKGAVPGGRGNLLEIKSS
ncbi:MAG: 50S ribosomal protein L3 [Patescibacteria group bacterium]|nr:50S ribosomal protein L3 [Patescibacteria group bacterium]